MTGRQFFRCQYWYLICLKSAQLGEGETENLDYSPKSFQAEYSRLKSCYHYKQIKCSSLFVRKSSSTKIVCNPTYRFIQIHVVSSAHIVRKMVRTNIPCESTSTGFMNSPDIAQSWIHPRVHLST